MMGMVLLFAMLETIAKTLSQTYPVPLIVWFRYVTHFFLMLLLLGPRYGSRLIKTDNPKAQIIRALLLMGSTLLYFTALSGLPLATAKSISFVSPLLVTIFALWFLNEHVSLGRWIAVVVGLLGVLLVISPSGAFNWYFVLPLMAAVCYSLYQIMTRRFSATEHPVTTLFYTGFVGSIVISLIAPVFWVTPDIGDLPLFLFLGFAGAFGHFMLIKAMELEDASFLSPLTYVQLIWVTLLGFFVFGHLPTNTGFMGMAIIVGAGLYVALGPRES